MAGNKSDTKRWEMTPEMAARMAHAAKYGAHSYIPSLLARQIVNDYHMTEGECLDIGAGNALLGIELAKLTNLKVTALDISPYMVKLACDEVSLNRLESRVTVVQGKAEEVPFESDRFDLIVSKGTLWFFNDKVKAFQEIYRVLKPGGLTYIGCGDAHKWPTNPSDFLKMIKFRIDMQRKKFQEEWRKLRLPPKEWHAILKQAGIEGYRFYPGYFWIEIRK